MPTDSTILNMLIDDVKYLLPVWWVFFVIPVVALAILLKVKKGRKVYQQGILFVIVAMEFVTIGMAWLLVKAPICLTLLILVIDISFAFLFNPTETVRAN